MSETKKGGWIGWLLGGATVLGLGWLFVVSKNSNAATTNGNVVKIVLPDSNYNLVYQKTNQGLGFGYDYQGTQSAGFTVKLGESTAFSIFNKYYVVVNSVNNGFQITVKENGITVKTLSV